MKNHFQRNRGPESASQPGQPLNTGRRGALTRMLAGGAAAGVTAASLPNAWTRPVVHSVLLPVHAQTTTEETGPEDGSFAFPDTLGQSDGLLNWLVPTAHAQTICVAAGCAALEDGVVTVRVADACGCCFSGTGGIGDSIKVTTSDSGCDACSIPDIEIVELTGAPRVLSIMIGDTLVDLTETDDTCDCAAVK